jgi:hypothetical protein
VKYSHQRPNTNNATNSVLVEAESVEMDAAIHAPILSRESQEQDTSTAMTQPLASRRMPGLRKKKIGISLFRINSFEVTY